MHVSTLTWIVTLAILVAVLVFDVFVIGRKPHEPSAKECGIAISVYVTGALLFAVFVWLTWDMQQGTEFIAGWLTEYSLSVDNLFIFLIIMSKLKVPRHLQQFALMVGIILALVLRGLFIALGAALISAFAWVFFIFGAFLVYTAVGLVRDYFATDNDEDAGDNFAIRLVKRRFRFTDDFHGTKLRVRLAPPGARRAHHYMTPMFLVVVALGSTDLLFALDSIPAIYGLTQQPYLVFTANVFALMGLRQLYFLLGGMLKRLVYLSLGLSVILAFIGVKLVLHALYHYGVIGFEVHTLVSLGVIVVTLVVTAVASLIKSAHTPPAGSDGAA
ncbi:MAG: TerC/Alx family metal homeostasis membrane protein [Propionibacteriaceae bacterium]|jgi:tellurite resistance protein TerC|nr:TerC/Alx family metal homeostasis membrane protein [Propionibacteriaceae bacterium]